MLEWMDEGVVCEFQPIAGGDRRGRPRASAEGNGKRDKAGPSEFIHLNLLSLQSSLNRVLADGGRGKVILASDSSLAWGFSCRVLVKLAANEGNPVVLAERSGGGPGRAGPLWQKRNRGLAAAPARRRLLPVSKTSLSVTAWVLWRQEMGRGFPLLLQRVAKCVVVGDPALPNVYITGDLPFSCFFPSL